MPASWQQGVGRTDGRGPRYELADIFRECGEAFRRAHPLPASHLKVMSAIESCRTAALGGHMDRCDQCGFEQHAYNSCRNRHCPKCQRLAKARWLEARQTELLPVPYFHNVFTLPHELNAVALYNKKLVFDLLFKSVSETLQEFGRDPKHGLGGKIGFIAILHTWDQQLRTHIHLHCVIPAGAVSFSEERWISGRKTFLFPVKAMSKVFRGKFIAFFKTAFTKGEITFPTQGNDLSSANCFSALIAKLWKKDWVVYSKAPFGGPKFVLEYLGRYTHRVAISNNRITNFQNNLVTFAYRDRKHCDKRKEMVLPADEFIRRFLLHIVPTSFMRIRYFGFLANRYRKSKITQCREWLGQPRLIPQVQRKTVQEWILKLTGIDINMCPCCKNGRMVLVAELPVQSRSERLSSTMRSPWDSS